MPLFSLTMIAGLVDGLNQRAIRTACLGRESSYVFHRLNHYLKKGLVILLILWLALPVSITPAYVFVPVSLLMGLMVAMTASRFKKYL
jgi:integrating conjugative element membrane protein (TIGR03747 family)